MPESIPVTDFFFVPESDEQEIEDLRLVLKHPAGRRLIRRLLSAGNALGTSMAADGHRTVYNEGLRAVGIWMATKIETAKPGMLAKLMIESVDDRQAENTKRSRREDDGD